MSVRIVVADDQAIVRDGLVTVLGLVDGFEIVGEAADGAEAVRLVGETLPDVVLMDLRMPELSGAEATAEILSAHPQIAVLVLTTFDDDDSIVGALRAGARGYLTKGAGRDELTSAIRAVASGQATFDAAVGARLVKSMTAGSSPLGTAADTEVDPSRAPNGTTPDALRARHPALTPREAEVFALVARGLTNPEIAADLFVSVATVKAHINTIFAKIDVATRAQAVALALG